MIHENLRPIISESFEGSMFDEVRSQFKPNIKQDLINIIDNMVWTVAFIQTQGDISIMVKQQTRDEILNG